MAAPIISRAALGDRAGAERSLAELCAARPCWKTVDEAVADLDDLARCSGADPTSLATLRAPLAELRTSLDHGRTALG
ncbi:hypothetical protein [Streptomyces asiaticus]